MTREVQFIGLPGPTHNFAGLSFGNLASIKSKGQKSNPRLAVKQTLDYMRFIHDFGVSVAVMPPHPRPYMPLLNNLGYSRDLKKISPELLRSLYSSAAMWVANCAIISPSHVTGDNKLHITPANLACNLHRSIESDFNYKLLNKIFSNQEYFNIHAPIFRHASLGDEGAANHHYFYQDLNNSQSNYDLFVYGFDEYSNNIIKPKKHPARQSLQAQLAIATNHKLDFNKVLFTQQNPEMIDIGVFHNDVIAVGHRDLYIYHENSYINKNIFNKLHDNFNFIKITDHELNNHDIIETYFFNSNIISNNNNFLILAPIYCQNNNKINNILTKIRNKIPNLAIKYIDLSESLKNGGGPACMRMRVILTNNELDQIHPNIIFSQDLYQQLNNWADRYCPTEIKYDNLFDKQLLDNSLAGLDELARILNLGNIYNL